MNRIAATVTAALFAASPALAQEFTGSQKAEIDAQIRAYILENPEIIIEAMEVLEERQRIAQSEADGRLLASLGDELFNDGFSHVAGNPDGDVTIVEFSDYRCGYCKQAHDGVQALVSADSNIRLIIKEFPILGPDSTFAARAAMASIQQGGDMYMDFNDALMRHRGELNQRSIMRIAREVGLDANALEEAMADPAIARNIQANYGLARQLDISGTPAFIIGDRIVRGFLPYDGLKELVEEAREAG